VHRRVLLWSGMAAGIVATVSMVVWITSDDWSRVIAQGDIVDRDAYALATFDESTAELISQDESTRVWRDSNGVQRTEMSFAPEWVSVGGEWVEISPELSRAASGEYIAERHPLRPEFSSSGDAASFLSVAKGDYTLEMGIAGASKVEPELSGPAGALEATVGLIYEGAVEGRDLVFGLDDHQIKQAVVLEQAPGGDETISWTVTAPGLAPQENEFGDLEFIDHAGVPVFVLALPSVWDSLGSEGVVDSAAINVPYAVMDEGDHFVLSVTVPHEWLAAPERVYPVMIDPNIIYESSVHGFKEDGYANTGVAQIGNSRQNATCCSWRTVLKYNLSAVSGQRVTNAYVYAYRRSGTSGNNLVRGGDVRHASAISFGGTGTWLSSFTMGYDGYAVDAGLFNWVAQQVNSSTWTGYLMLRGDENNATYSYKSIYSRMVVDTVPRPVVGSVTSASIKTPAGATTTATYADAVVVEGTGTNYTPGTSLQYRYVFSSSDGGVAWTSPWTGPGLYRVPGKILTPGKNYSYTVQVRDTGAQAPIVSRSDGTWKFYTHGTPQPPTNLAVDGTQLTGVVAAQSTRPTISAHVAKADGAAGGQVWALFTVKQGDIVVVDSLPGSAVLGSGGVSQATLPYALPSGVEYTVEVTAFDGYLQSASVQSGGSFTLPERQVRELPTVGDTNVEVAS